jgi:hypothetical protein
MHITSAETHLAHCSLPSHCDNLCQLLQCAVVTPGRIYLSLLQPTAITSSCHSLARSVFGNRTALFGNLIVVHHDCGCPMGSKFEAMSVGGFLRLLSRCVCVCYVVEVF